MLAKIKFKQGSAKDLLGEFSTIQKNLHEVYKEAPNTTKRAVKKAEAAIEKNKDGVYSDEEIDKILPDTLRRGSST